MPKSNFEIGDLVEIQQAETDFKAHNGIINGKIGLVIEVATELSLFDLYRVLVEGQTVPVLGKHLKKVKLRDKQ